jgi:hypothetical protein
MQVVMMVEQRLSRLDELIDDLGVSISARVNKAIQTFLQVVQLLAVFLNAREARQEMLFEVGD